MPQAPIHSDDDRDLKGIVMIKISERHFYGQIYHVDKYRLPFFVVVRK